MTLKDKIIAIDLGGTSAKLALIHNQGAILDKWSVPTDTSNQGQSIVPNLIQNIQEYLATGQVEANELLGIGMGTPGSVDIHEQTVIGAYNLNWRTVQEVGKAFMTAFDLPFYIDNDANIAALGEQWAGAGNQSQHIIMVTLGTGVGGGIVVNGQIVHGQGAAGEIGHMTVETQEPISCTCGKSGCLETVASATGVVNIAKQLSVDFSQESDLLKELHQEGSVSSERIFKAGQAGDPFAMTVVDRFAFYLGLAAANLANILNPAKIIFGGGVSNAGDYLIQQVMPYYHAYTFPQIRESTEITLANLGNDAGILGAAQLVRLAMK